jgi:hypothetical protein
MGIEGISGSGKSVSAVAIMRGVIGPEGKMAAIDSERESLMEYAGLFPGTDQPVGFDHKALVDCSVEAYIEAIDNSVEHGYDGIIIDSASHEWAGKGGILESVDRDAGEDGFFSKKGWRKATPKHNLFIEKVTGSPIHVIVTLRVKSEFAIEKNAEGKNEPRKIGMQTIQREGFDYEFSILGRMNEFHDLHITKSRMLDRSPEGILTNPLEHAVINRPGILFGETLRAWLNAPVGDWVPPSYSRTFIVNGKEIVSGGITKETYLTALNAGAKADKAKGPGTARALLAATFKAPNCAALTEPQGTHLIELLRTLEAAS